MQRKAFTWIEAVVVLAILMVGAMILSSTMGQSRGNARRSSCASNLKQIGLAFIQYAQDADETAPPVANERGGWSQLLVPYIKSPAIFHCPSARGGETGATDYYYNARLAGAKNKLKLYRSNKPSYIILSGEGEDDQKSSYNLSRFPDAWRTDERAPAWRHIETGNFLFVDGHVKSFNQKRIFGAPDAATASFEVK